jgi:hypothetical protein
MDEQSLPQIPLSDLTSLGHEAPPRPLIQTDEDVHAWQRSECYSHLLLYIRRLGESVVGEELSPAPAESSGKQVGAENIGHKSNKTNLN